MPRELDNDNNDIYTESTTVTTVTTTATISGISQTIIIKGSTTYTITLPDATSCPDVRLKFIKDANTLANPVTIDGYSTQTIGTYTTVQAYTKGELWDIQSNGSNWVILSHLASTAWAATTPATITSTSASPAKPTTLINDSYYWRRCGKIMEMHYLFSYTNNAGGGFGSGDYVWTIANSANLSMDTDIVRYTTGEDVGNFEMKATNVGYGAFSAYDGIAVQNHNTIVVPYSTTQFRLFCLGSSGTPNGAIGANYWGMNTRHTNNFYARVPISQWQE